MHIKTLVMVHTSFGSILSHTVQHNHVRHTADRLHGHGVIPANRTGGCRKPAGVRILPPLYCLLQHAAVWTNTSSAMATRRNKGTVLIKLRNETVSLFFLPRTIFRPSQLCRVVRVTLIFQLTAVFKKCKHETQLMRVLIYLFLSDDSVQTFPNLHDK